MNDYLYIALLVLVVYFLASFVACLTLAILLRNGFITEKNIKRNIDLLNSEEGGDWYYDHSTGTYCDSMTDRTQIGPVI